MNSDFSIEDEIRVIRNKMIRGEMFECLKENKKTATELIRKTSRTGVVFRRAKTLQEK